MPLQVRLKHPILVEQCARLAHCGQDSHEKVGVTKKLATTTEKGAPSKSTTSKEACKAASSTPVDISPNRLTSPDTFGDLDMYDGGSNSFESHKSRSCSRSPTSQNVSVALKEITSLLNTVVKRMDRMDSELKRHSTSVSSSSSGECTKKSKVPLVVKVNLLALSCHKY